MISIANWVDLTDGHEYRDGDTFPHDGKKISAKRIEELSTAANSTGFPVIRAEDGENTTEEEEAPKTAEKEPKK